MANKKIRRIVIAFGLILAVVGVVIAIGSMPVFTFMKDDYRSVLKSESIANSTFEINQTQDKLIEFQLAFHQNVTILAAGTQNFNFSIANFTDPNHISNPEEPDVDYLPLRNVTLVNVTWTPELRTPETSTYYLVFLPWNASLVSSVRITANVTKSWTELQTFQTPYQDVLIDPSYVYLGMGILVSGTALLIAGFFLPHGRRRRTSQGKLGE